MSYCTWSGRSSLRLGCLHWKGAGDGLGMGRGRGARVSASPGRWCASATLFCCQLGGGDGLAGQVRLGDPLGFPPPSRTPMVRGGPPVEGFRTCPLISRCVA